MSFRDKFKGAKLSTLKEVQKDADSNKKSFFERDGGRLGFLTVEDGKNVFRILPPHPDDKVNSPYLPCRRAMLRCEVGIYENGETTGKTEVRSKYVFIATQHGGLPKDPIETYIEYVRKRAEDEFSDKTDRQKFLSPVTGYKDKKGNWNWGITPKTTFISYAVKDGVLGRFELWESWIKEMDKLSISEDPDDVMSIDPFSDPNEGFPLIITRQKNDKNKVEYIISKDEPSRAKRESWELFFERTKITDSQLEELLKQKPLSDFYGKDIYTKRDFELAIDGLRRFDEENKYNIFDNEEFLEELEQIEKLVPEPKDKDDDVKEIFSKSTEGKQDQQEDNELNTIPIIRRTLKKFIVKEYGEEFVDQLPQDEKTLRQWYKIYEQGDDLPFNSISQQSSVPKVEEKVQPVVDTTDSISESDLSNEIAKLRARRNRS